MIRSSGGDARHLLNQIEMICQHPSNESHFAELEQILQKRPALLTTKIEKVITTSYRPFINQSEADPDAALYWLARMLEGGEEPLFLARRIAAEWLLKTLVWQIPRL